ncbi:MAG: hypothetical protein ACRC33_14030, partial [Gemmataceae bacterium]
MSDRPPRRWRRRATVALVVLGVVVASALIGVRLYLTPSRSAGLVRDELVKLLNAPVEIGSASIGLVGQTTLSGVKVGDFLEADSVTADLSVVGAARGARPTALTLTGTTLRLRFDKDGTLLTKLPGGTGAGALPAVRVNGGTVVLEQEGRKPFAVSGATLDVRPDGDISGAIDDPRAGNFAVAGRLTASPVRLTLKLTQDHAKVTPALLKEIPFIPPSLWDTLTADGDDVAVAVHLDITTTVKYRGEVQRAAVTLLQTDR